MKIAKIETNLEKELTVKISCANLINALIYKNFSSDHDYCEQYQERGEGLVVDPVIRDKVLEFLKLGGKPTQVTKQGDNENNSSILLRKSSQQEAINRYPKEEVSWALEMVAACEAARAELNGEFDIEGLLGSINY